MINLDSLKNNFASVDLLPKSYSLDDPQRFGPNRSPLSRLVNAFDANIRLKEQVVSEKLKEIFKERYGYQESSLAFEKVWERLGATIWTPSRELTAGMVREIDHAFKTRLLYHGKGIAPSQEVTNNSLGALLQNLVHGAPFPEELLNLRTLRAFLLKKDPEILQQFRQAIQKELINLSNQSPQNEQETLVWNAFLGNLLGFIPFSYPNTGDTLQIPVLESGTCRLVEYTVELIQLEFNKLSSSMPAVAMNPKNDPNASPTIAFLGTTFPSGEGFASTLQSDFTPAYSVGELAYEINQEKIAEWIGEKKNVRAVGISLGGAMALHALRHHHQQISRLDVYNPPGLYENCWNTDLGHTCEINIYCQPKDLVSKLGCWPIKGKINTYEVLQHQGISENLFSSHVKAFSGASEISIIKGDPKLQNQSLARKILTILHRVLGSLLVFLPVEFILLMRHYLQILLKFGKRTYNDLLDFIHTIEKG